MSARACTDKTHIPSAFFSVYARHYLWHISAEPSIIFRTLGMERLSELFPTQLGKCLAVPQSQLNWNTFFSLSLINSRGFRKEKFSAALFGSLLERAWLNSCQLSPIRLGSTGREGFHLSITFGVSLSKVFGSGPHWGGIPDCYLEQTWITPWI